MLGRHFFSSARPSSTLFVGVERLTCISPSTPESDASPCERIWMCKGLKSSKRSLTKSLKSDLRSQKLPTPVTPPAATKKAEALSPPSLDCNSKEEAPSSPVVEPAPKSQGQGSPSMQAHTQSPRHPLGDKPSSDKRDRGCRASKPSSARSAGHLLDPNTAHNRPCKRQRRRIDQPQDLEAFAQLWDLEHE